jgi:CheY-like chemotaxis protein
MASQSLIVLELAEPARGPPPRKRPRPGPEPKADSGAARKEAHNNIVVPKTIALVEDQAELLSTYNAVFSGLGWSTFFSGEKGEDLIKLAKSEGAKPALVIMDYRLPGMDGIDAGRRLRRIVPDIKIVITTADDSIREEAESAGFYFLQKPFSISTLVEFLAGL